MVLRNPWNSTHINPVAPLGATHSHSRRLVMPQSYTCLHYHTVFSTKHRDPLISVRIRERLWEYLAQIVRGAKGIPIQIGGTDDHVHLLVTLRQDPSIAAFM